MNVALYSYQRGVQTGEELRLVIFCLDWHFYLDCCSESIIERLDTSLSRLARSFTNCFAVMKSGFVLEVTYAMNENTKTCAEWEARR
jgi:hypothetical protein